MKINKMLAILLLLAANIATLCILFLNRDSSGTLNTVLKNQNALRVLRPSNVADFHNHVDFQPETYFDVIYRVGGQGSSYTFGSETEVFKDALSRDVDKILIVYGDQSLDSVEWDKFQKLLNCHVKWDMINFGTSGGEDLEETNFAHLFLDHRKYKSIPNMIAVHRSYFKTLLQRDHCYEDVESNVYTFCGEDRSPKKSISFFLTCKTCLPSLHKIERQKIELDKESRKNPEFCYYHCYGDPDLEEPFSVDERRKIIVLKCADDYLGLSFKYGEIMRMVNVLMQNNESMRDLKGTMNIDDDVTIKPGLVEFMWKHELFSYYGKLVNNTSSGSNWLQKRCNRSESFRTTVSSRYPSIMKYSIQRPTIPFIAGPASYVAAKLLPHFEGSQFFKPFPGSEKELQTYVQNNNIEGLTVLQDIDLAAFMKSLGVHPVNTNIKSVLH